MLTKYGINFIHDMLSKNTYRELFVFFLKGQIPNYYHSDINDHPEKIAKLEVNEGVNDRRHRAILNHYGNILKIHIEASFYRPLKIYGYALTSGDSDFKIVAFKSLDTPLSVSPYVDINLNHSIYLKYNNLTIEQWFHSWKNRINKVG